MKIVVVATAVLVPAALLAACAAMEEVGGPTYRVEYLLKPPATEDGRRCVASCEKLQAYCQRETEKGDVNEHRLCQQRAADEYELCVGRTTSVSEKNACYRRACTVGPGYVNCEVSYRSCFENCGGEVWSRTVCETGC